jgi:hypothetical protein
MSIIRTPIRMRLPIPDRDKVDLGLPVCTLDVNQVAVRPTYHLRPEMRGLVSLEYNYFERRTIELCVTPETAVEIGDRSTAGGIGSLAYQRFSKSELFKARPASTVLDLSTEEADELWSDVCDSLWPDLSTGGLRRNQEADVTQLFFQVPFSIRRKVRRAGKYAGNPSAARGFQGAGLEWGGPLLALGQYGWHGIS